VVKTEGDRFFDLRREGDKGFLGAGQQIDRAHPGLRQRHDPDIQRILRGVAARAQQPAALQRSYQTIEGRARDAGLSFQLSDLDAIGLFGDRLKDIDGAINRTNGLHFSASWFSKYVGTIDPGWLDHPRRLT
jgi:hypothetical protein